MSELPFRLDLVQFLVEHRNPYLTLFFQSFTFLGSLEGYILVIALVYAAYDKKLAVRLAVVTLLTMSVNHILKTLIRNPRPFIRDHTYLQKWAVSPEAAADLATEYSTPSGHAMASASFFTYLGAATSQGYLKTGFALVVVLIGLSRPYLGVHYFEDVLSGWVLGALVAYVCVRNAHRVGARWNQLCLGGRAIALTLSSGVLWLVTRALSDWSGGDPPSAFISYAGLLTGILIAQPLEDKLVHFDPRGSSMCKKAVRYALAVAIVIGILSLFKAAFSAISIDSTPLGQALRYVRYAAAGIAGLLVAPWLFVRVGLAEATRAEEGREGRCG